MSFSSHYLSGSTEHVSFSSSWCNLYFFVFLRPRFHTSRDNSGVVQVGNVVVFIHVSDFCRVYLLKLGMDKVASFRPGKKRDFTTVSHCYPGHFACFLCLLVAVHQPGLLGFSGIRLWVTESHPLSTSHPLFQRAVWRALNRLTHLPTPP